LVSTITRNSCGIKRGLKVLVTEEVRLILREITHAFEEIKHITGNTS
jgi:hypothetical protein